MHTKWSLLPLALALAAVSGPGPGRAPIAGGQAAPDSTWLKWNPATRTTTFKLVAGIPGRAKSPFNFNGYTDGELTLAVPAGSTVVMNFVNDDGTPHSAQVIPDARPIPNMALDEPAILRAYTRAAGCDALQGHPAWELSHFLRGTRPRPVRYVDPFQGERSAAGAHDDRDHVQLVGRWSSGPAFYSPACAPSPQRPSSAQAFRPA
jgi:Sulfocyanin (SoxE) domain